MLVSGQDEENPEDITDPGQGVQEVDFSVIERQDFRHNLKTMCLKTSQQPSYITVLQVLGICL